MSLSSADIKNIVETLQESAWDEAVVVVGDVRIAVARNGATLAEQNGHASAAHGAAPAAVPAGAPAPAAAQALAAAPVPAPAAAPAHPAGAPAAPSAGPATQEGHVITSPSVGVFWRSPEPGAAPFAEVGDHVEVGDTLCIIEIMKLMSNVSSDVAGVVTAVHLDNAAGVEHGTPLFTIQPDA
ncbi:acetyl-CoA carboxylase biotin carboxyl carrier protein [Georgenia thermotolerans]|uniref:acetyl-CoA carboxylase biotin carboxyl carrier protein n=1 Tax=Georgenia thermotolerans TaxID=527326 RepID=UPI001B8D6A0C|nr:biotin/lipoyl-containing protein [Georgenia thermotolerans]